MKLPNCTISKVSTQADRSVKIVLETQELSPEAMAALFSSYGEEMESVEVDIIPEDGGRSPSTRLRSVLYVIWEHKGKKAHPEFETFYRSKMNAIIEQLKEKIE